MEVLLGSLRWRRLNNTLGVVGAVRDMCAAVWHTLLEMEGVVATLACWMDAVR